MKHALFLSLFVALAACNTVEGVGQDISGSANAVRGWFSH